MKKLMISTILFLVITAVNAQRNEVPVFTSGEGGSVLGIGCLVLGAWY